MGVGRSGALTSDWREKSKSGTVREAGDEERVERGKYFSCAYTYHRHAVFCASSRFGRKYRRRCSPPPATTWTTSKWVGAMEARERKREEGKEEMRGRDERRVWPADINIRPFALSIISRPSRDRRAPQPIRKRVIQGTEGIRTTCAVYNSLPVTSDGADSVQ